MLVRRIDSSDLKQQVVTYVDLSKVRKSRHRSMCWKFNLLYASLRNLTVPGW